MTTAGTEERILVAALPLRHLQAAADADALVLPAGGPGDLDVTPPGTPVRLIATDAGGTEIPAATWGAAYVGRVPYAPGDPWPDRVPPSWTAAHEPSVPATTPDGDDDDLDDERIGPQSFFEVTGLAPLPRGDWIFANELVAKQERDGRTFVPRTPRLVTPVD